MKKSTAKPMPEQLRKKTTYEPSMGTRHPMDVEKYHAATIITRRLLLKPSSALLVAASSIFVAINAVMLKRAEGKLVEV